MIDQESNDNLFFVADTKADLDGDGTQENISLATDHYNNNINLTINYVSITSLGSNLDKMIKIVDMDTTDLLKEIAVPESGPSSDNMVSFYAYIPTNIIFMGKVGGVLDKSIDITGSGEIIARTRAHIFQTWFYKDTYQLIDNHTLVHVVPPDDLYSMNNEQVTVKKSIPIYKTPNGELLVDLKVGEKVTLLKSDDKEKILLKTESGKQGWILIERFDHIKGTNYSASDVFDGLNYAD